MSKLRVGVNLPGSTKFNNLESELQRIVNDGFNACELNLGTFPLIIGGKLQPQVVEYMQKVLSSYPLVYSAHIGYGLDLRNLDDYELHYSVLFASIEACSKLDIKVLNLHYEEESRFSKSEKAFRKAHIEAADYAAEKNVLLCIENIETDISLKAFKFVKDVNHPNLKSTLDTGHLFLSSTFFGYDYFEAVEAVLPQLGHLHINDNPGVFETLRLTDFDSYKILDRGYRFAYSSGDIHIPPFWGEAPLEKALTLVKKSGYEGIWLCEYYSESFIPFNKDVQSKVRLFIEQA